MLKALRTAAVRILRAALGWLVADQHTAQMQISKPPGRRKRTGRTDQHTDSISRSERKGRSWFECEPEELRAVMGRNPDDEDAEAWYRQYFRCGWPRG